MGSWKLFLLRKRLYGALLHKPVLLQEVLEGLALKPGMTVVDGTLGSGGHAGAILEKIGPSGRLIGLDQDPKAIERCKKLFGDDRRVTLHQANFRNLEELLRSLQHAPVNAIMMDIGFSSDQLADESRGFSFESKGELDMRMNPDIGISAKELIQNSSEYELATLFRDYGEERYAGRYARAIAQFKQTHPIETPDDLISAIETVLPDSLKRKDGKKPAWVKRHPATQVFQALRIAVNDELGALKEGMKAAFESLAPGGRLAILSFHSLEDRLIKNQFRTWHQEKTGKRMNKKVIVATDEELKDNPRSRSAKLRVIEKAL